MHVKTQLSGIMQYKYMFTFKHKEVSVHRSWGFGYCF